MTTVYRICKSKYTATAFDGEGAFQFGGRWNSRGTRLVYVAENLSLAVLEMLVHFQDDGILAAYSFIEATFDESLVESAESRSKLPKNWQTSPPPFSTQQIGDNWAKRGLTMALKVSSTIIPSESNYLLNPNHKDFSKITFGEPQSFKFDQRLL
jgi:RES domain-containing protein